MLISNVVMFIQCQFEMMLSVPWSKKIVNGIKLMKNAVLTAVLTCVVAQSGFCGFGLRVMSSG